MNRLAALAFSPLPALAVAGALFAGSLGTPPPWAGDGQCKISWCQEGGLDAEIDNMLRVQVEDLGCDYDKKRKVFDEVAVRNAKMPNAGVVRKVDFTSGWEDAKSGKVWIVGYC